MNSLNRDCAELKVMIKVWTGGEETWMSFPTHTPTQQTLIKHLHWLWVEG